MVDEQNPDGSSMPGTTGTPPPSEAAGSVDKTVTKPESEASDSDSAAADPIDGEPTQRVPETTATTEEVTEPVPVGSTPPGSAVTTESLRPEGADTVPVQPPRPSTAGVTAAVNALPRWSARAGVRPAGMRPDVDVPDGSSREWAEPVIDDPYGGQSWLTPVIVSGVALVLFVVLGVGLWLIYGALWGHDDGSTPGQLSTASPTPTPEETTAAPSPSEENTRPPATSAAPSPTHTFVIIPRVAGTGQAAATAALTSRGLKVVVEEKEDATAAPGTVLGTNPAEGVAVTPKSTVTLIVAKAPSPSPSPSPTKSPTPTPTAPGGPHVND